MEIEIKSQSDDEIVFIVRDAEVPFINAIRRCAMVNVPKIAIEDVNIVRNDSAMFNEVLAHRLGLTPLVSNIEAIEGLPLPEDDGWEYNEETDSWADNLKKGVIFKLNEVGPKVVYSKDLISSDETIKPVYDTIPLVKLKDGEVLDIEAVAKVGYGKEHAKWMPTTVCAYKQYPEITFDEDKEVDYDCALACPRGVLKSDRRSKHIKILDIENCTMCKSCVRASSNGYINVGYRENDFIFRIETDGSMPPKEVLLKACDKLGEKAEKFKKIIKTNPNLIELINKLNKQSKSEDAAIWKDVADKLSRSNRRTAEVNLSDIARYAEAGETVLVPGKVLSNGDLTEKVDVVALKFSAKAQEKIESAGGECISIDEIIESNPKGSNIRIME